MINKIMQNPAILNAIKQYEMLPSRDRMALKVLAVVLVLCGLYFGAWVPAQNYMTSAADELERNQSLLTLVNENKHILKSLSANNAASGTTTLNSQQLVSSVTNLAKQQGLNLKRFEPSGENKLKVWMDDQPFDKMASWLSALKKSLNVSVEQISVEKEDAEGLISARLTLSS